MRHRNHADARGGQGQSDHDCRRGQSSESRKLSHSRNDQSGLAGLPIDRYSERSYRHLPSRVLSHKPPLEVYPRAIHLGRFCRPEWEEELLSLEKVCTYLAQDRWFRSVRTNGFFGLGGYQYYLGKHFAMSSIAIRFDPDTMALFCQPQGSEETIRLPTQGRTSAELMGELAVLQALPISQ